MKKPSAGDNRFFRGKRVFLTGGSGFLGSHLARRLCGGGARVTLLLEPASATARIKDILDGVSIVEGDIRDYNSVRNAVRRAGPEVVYHLATMIDNARNLDLIDVSIDTNIRGATNLARAVTEQKRKVACFVNTGTCEEYGDNKPPFNELQKEAPVSPYSASKVAATYYCRMMHAIFGLPVVTVRPFLTYGPSQDLNRFVPSLISHALSGRDFRMTSGTQTRELNYVDDIISAFLAVPRVPKAIGEVVNIGNGREYTMREIAQKIISLTGSAIKLHYGSLAHRPGESRRFFSDSAKAGKLLGWKPMVSLDEGLKRTIPWYRENTLPLLRA